jgi:hypothetical protein
MITLPISALSSCTFSARASAAFLSSEKSIILFI